MHLLRLAILLLFIFNVHYLRAQSYTNVAQLQGLNFLAESDNFGNGVSFFDFDQDGWDDLSFTMSNDSLEFYRNNMGTLERMPSFVYGDGVVKHVLWVDYDNDGDMDLMVSPYQKPYKLYQNDGAFNFTDVSVACGLAQTNEKHYGVSFGDYNRDGFLDLYVCTYEFEGDPSMYNRLNHLYRNNGDGTFADVTLDAGVEDGITFSFQSIWMDYNKDGWPDLLVINDRLHANSLYHNNTDGTFTNVALEAGVAWPGQDPMSASVADFDNDGDLDVFHSNTGIVNKHFRLWVNNDDGTFTESATQYGLEIYSWTWGALWVDFDNDTFQDLYVTSSLPNGPLESNFFLTSVQGTGFLNGLSNFSGSHIARSFAASRGDLNNDGYYEIAVQNQNPFKPFLWQNSGGDANFIKISLQGTASNRMAIGSWIRVYAGGNQYTKYTLCGEDYVGQSSQHYIFGLADYLVVDSVQIEYLSGHIDAYYTLEVNQHYYFVEGDTYQAAISYQGNLFTCAGNSIMLSAGEHYLVEWSNGLTDSEINIVEPGFYWFVAQNEFGIVTYSDTVFIEVLPLPIISVQTQDPLCAGDETGIIFITNDLGIESAAVVWSNGMEGDSLNYLSAGNYLFEFTDLNGCIQTGIAQLQEPEEMLVQVFTSPDLGDSSGSIQLVINGGTPPYQVFLNGFPEENNIMNLEGGEYDVQVIDFNGCIYQTTAIIDLINKIAASHQNIYVSVFPNPSDGLFNVSCADKIDRIQLMDVTGQLIAEFVGQGNQIILDLKSYAKAIYLLQIDTSKKTYRTKLVLR